MTTNENITIGDIMDLHTGHDVKKSGNTISVVLGVVGAIIVIAILWFAFVRRDGLGKNTEKETNVNIGETNGTLSEMRAQMRGLVEHERQDALKIAYTDGRLQPYGFAYGSAYYGGGCGCGGGRGYEHEHGHEHHKHHCGANFQEVKTFTPTTDVVTLTSNCNCG